MRPATNWEGLAAKIRAIEQRHGGGAPLPLRQPDRDGMPSGWAEIDAALHGGLPAGLHEWFGLEGGTSREWSPPVCLMSHLAWQALSHNPLSPWIAWIGKSCHPYPRMLLRGHGSDMHLMRHSLYALAPKAATRVWAIEVALRCPLVSCVIADGNGFNTAATRRLQLLAREQAKWILLVRPPAQSTLLSAAQTRWRVSVVASTKQSMRIQPRWSVELLRCKGIRPDTENPAWVLEWDRDEGTVRLSSGLADLARPTPKELVRRHAV